MENTGKVLFGNDTTPQWHVAVGEQTMGPMSTADVYDRIRSGELSWVHYVWKNGQAQWTRACDTPTFQVAMPQAPAKPPSGPPKPPVVKEIRNWYLYYNDTQFGPFSAPEVQGSLEAGKLHGRVHAWKDGMGGWVRLEELAEFSHAAPQGSQKPAFELATSDDKRKAPRFPLIARILVADDAQVSVAICRDISIGGMQVLTDRLPGPVGTRLKLNVSPASAKTSTGKKVRSTIEAFVAEGEVVRILEDGRGYSFRFNKLPEKSRKAIESYIQESNVE